MRFLPFAALAFCLSGCSSQAQIGPEIVTLPPDEAFAAVEQILQDTPYLTADQVEVRADSAMTIHLVGTLQFAPGNRLILRGDGVFVDFGADARLRLVSDGARMVGGRSADVGFDEAAPRDLRKAVAVGFTRMGLLHNLTRLYTGSAPDHADGGVTRWVEARDFAWGEESRIQGRPTRPLSFTVRIDGEDTAEATLYLDAATGLPVYRTQRIPMATGAMVVTERYAGWIDREVPDAAFAVEPAPFEPDPFP